MRSGLLVNLAQKLPAPSLPGGGQHCHPHQALVPPFRVDPTVYEWRMVPSMAPNFLQLLLKVERCQVQLFIWWRNVVSFLQPKVLFFLCFLIIFVILEGIPRHLYFSSVLTSHSLWLQELEETISILLKTCRKGHSHYLCTVSATIVNSKCRSKGFECPSLGLMDSQDRLGWILEQRLHSEVQSVPILVISSLFHF